MVLEVFKPLPSMVVAHYLGVPAEDRARFDGWTDAIVAANAHGDPLAAADAVGELFGYFATLAERRRADPRDDTISQLVRTDPGTDPAELALVIGFAFTMVTGRQRHHDGPARRGGPAADGVSRLNERS